MNRQYNGHEGLLKLFIEGTKDQGCNSYVEMKRKVDKREEWKIPANQSTDCNYRYFPHATLL